MSTAVAPGLEPGSLGVDAGASLWKLVLQDSDALQQRVFGPRDPALLEAVEASGADAIGLTGGGAAELARRLPAARVVPEFEAWVAGAPLLAARTGLALADCYLLVSVGTGASAILIRDGSGVRVGGTALGGGSLLGLGRLLLDTRSFEELVGLAALGDRRRVDLLVGDLYRDGTSPLPPNLPAAHFGKLDSTERADVAHALVGVVAQNLALICGQLALTYQARAVLYCGSTVGRNAPLQEILREQTALFGAAVEFPEGGAYCGALGAAAVAAASA